ncbi:MAG TPA: LeuA family protein [bacterium]|nr:LeuA family protein [bacterium]
MIKPVDLIYDWNTAGQRPRRPRGPLDINDETLRDGLQSPSVRQPSAEQKRVILHLMDDLGISAVNLGYPGAGPQALDDVVALAREIRGHRLHLRPNCAGRTTEADIVPIAEAQQRSGVAIEAALFLGSSPIRQYVEGWDVEFLLRTADAAVTHARRLGLEVMFVTEDTTRARPDDLRRLYTAAVAAGAGRICVADTVGHATPWGAWRLVRFMRRVVGDAIAIDWHGHRDRGLDVINALAAAEAGADRLHACALGIGERVGNTSMEQLLVNLRLLDWMGWVEIDLRALPAYCRAVADAVGLPMLPNYPVVGKDAFETSSGVHAAAILKALRRDDRWLADRVYSSVPAEEVGREQRLTIGPMSGQANVVYWCEQHRVPPHPDFVRRVLDCAKASTHVLCDEEILALVTSGASSYRTAPVA